MPRESHIHALLNEGRSAMSAGRSFDAALLALEQPRLVPQLVECLWDEDEGIAGRAADALETVALEAPRSLARWKDELLGLLAETSAKRLLWRIPLILTRLPLTPPECRRMAEILNNWLDDSSSITKTVAMQSLAELTILDSSLQPDVLDLLRGLTRSGTPAMRARGRHLLSQMERGERPNWPRQKHQARAAARLIKSSHAPGLEPTHD